MRVIILLVALLYASAAGAAELSRQAAPPQDPFELARQHKQAGDLYVAADDLDKAADAYIQALDLGRESFSPDERVRMAFYLSLADRLARAEKELRDVLAAEPGNLEARVRLARVLSWRGEVTEAIKEADRVLKESPENRQALQIKADALQWKGDLRSAIPLYEELVRKGDDFDARLGLSYSFLYAGNSKAAAETARVLKPANAPEQRRFSRFQDRFEAVTRPRLELGYQRFNDSDRNLIDRYGVSQNFWVNNFELGVNFRHSEARDATRRNRAEDFSLKAYTNPNESFGLGGKLGLTQLGRGDTSSFWTGELKIDGRFSDATASASVSREVLTDSAELIDNRVRATNVAIQGSYQLTDRLSVHPGYRYRALSDSNHAHDAQFTSQYLLLFNPKLGIGHRFRYLDYNRQSGRGYFDPNDYYSNRLFVTYYIERERYYFFSDLFVGQQAFRRNRVGSKDLVYGGAGSVGYRPLRNLLMEFAIEGGQFASGASAGGGYTYLLLGPRVWIRF